VLERWAAWSRGTRWLVGGIAAVVVAVAVSWWLLVPATDWLTRHDVGSAKVSNLQSARDAARGRLLTFGAGLFAAGALLFTARNFALSREGQVTDRYTKAIEQLGSDKLDVRIGGIYALERIARDSARDHPTVMEVLAAFIREHSHEQAPAPEHDTDQARPRTTRPDLQAALTVVGRRDVKRDIRRADLARADLSGASLTYTDLSGVDLTGADLSGASLIGADLALANLNGADLSGARLDVADLHGANLDVAVLTGADLTGADLSGASLLDADLTGADLTNADLTGARLTSAYFAGPNLTRTRWPENKPVPEGWKLDTSSGLLNPSDTGSGPAEAN